MNRIYVILILFCAFNSTAQKVNTKDVLKQYANDVLLPDDLRLKEMPVRDFTGEEVLNGQIKWKNPYPTLKNVANEGFDISKVGKVPAKGIYPRIFTSPAEFATIKNRLENTKAGKQLLDLSNRELSEMRQGKGKFGKLYQDLLSDNQDWKFEMPSLLEMSNLLAIQGLLAQLNNDKTLLNETSRVSANLIKISIRLIDSAPVVPGRELMVKEDIYNGGKLAKLFDFTAAGMSASDKKIFYDFFVRETKGKYGDGMQLPHHWRRWNHIASSMSYPLSILVLEGQSGYDKRIYDRGAEMLQDYLTYTFSSEGMSPEGLTYTFGPFSLVLQFMSAVIRRGTDNPFANPHFRAIPDWLIAALSPNPVALWSSHGDTGSASGIPLSMMMLLKYYFPNDAKIDYLLANVFTDKIAQLPDVSSFVFVADPENTAAQYNAVPPTEMPLTFFSPQRGSMITRNKWGKEGVMFQFDARQDMYYQSHDHSDRGNFWLGSHGRLWVVDGWRSTESKYHSVITIDGRGQGYFPTPANWLDYSDQPEATFGVIDYKYCFDWMWLKSPVADKLLGKPVAKQWQTGVYEETAQRLKTYYPNEKPERDPLRKVAEYFSGSLETNPLIWKEDTWPMRLLNYKVEHAFRTAGMVKGVHNYILIVDDLKKDGQERLYEWNMPMPLDVELVSIKQLVDVTQGSGALDIGFNSFSNKGIQGEFDIILGDKRMDRNRKEVDNAPGESFEAGRFVPRKGDPQLLVRVLERTPAPRPNLEPNPRLEVIEKLKTEDMHQFYLRTMDIGKRLVIPSRSSDPNFKVLLVPYAFGEEMPHTAWSQNRTHLKVEWSDQKDEFVFSKGENSRTKVKMIRDGRMIFDL
ncbi:MAG: hypothetical protein WCK18_17010 [Prolixibacteraceae bacterium]